MRLSSRSRGRVSGSASLEFLVVLATVGVLALGAMAKVGGAMRTDIAGDGAQAKSSRMVTSAQAGALNLVPRILEHSRDAAEFVGVLKREFPAADRVIEAVDSLPMRNESGRIAGARYFGHHHPDTHVQLHVNLPNTPKPAGGYPTVMVLPGLGAFPWIYKDIPKSLLDAGFATVLFELPNAWTFNLAKRVRRAMGAVDTLQANFGDELDMTRFAEVGHSFGGGTVTVQSAIDPRVDRVVALAPGYVPDLGAMRESLRTRSMQRNHALIEESAASPHAPRLIIGADHDMVVGPENYAKPIHAACTTPGHCTYAEIDHAGHNNFGNMPGPMVPVLWPTKDNLLRVRKVDLWALSPKARTGVSQRQEAIKLILPYLEDLLTHR